MSAAQTAARVVEPTGGLVDWVTRIPAWPTMLVAALVAGTDAIVVLAGDVLVRPGWFAAFIAYNLVAFAAVGLVWRHRRPASPVALLLLAVLPAIAVTGLQGSSSSVPFSLGVLVDPVLAALWWYILLAFPSTRLTRAATGVLLLGLAAVVVGFLPWFFLSEHVAGSTPLARCTPDCPTQRVHVGVAARRGCRLRHGRAGRAPGRVRHGVRDAAPGPDAAGQRAAPAGARSGVRRRHRVVGRLRGLRRGAPPVRGEREAGRRARLDAHGRPVALPLSFAAALALAQVFAGKALKTTMQRLRGHAGRAELERAVRAALGDRSLRLATWHPQSESWVDVAGEPLESHAAGPGRAWQELRTRDARWRPSSTRTPSTTTPSSWMRWPRPCCSTSTTRARRCRWCWRACVSRSGAWYRRARRSAAGSNATCTTARSSA